MFRNNALAGKIFYSLLVILIYIAGRDIPLPWVIRQPVTAPAGGIQHYLSQLMGSEMQSASILALGLAPMMSASILTSLIRSVTERPGHRQRSARVYSGLTMGLTFLFAIVQAFVRSRGLQFAPYAGLPAGILQLLTVSVWTAGAFVTVWLTDRNTAWGIGDQSLLILVNILYGLRQTVWQQYTSIGTHLAGSQQQGIELLVLSLVIIAISLVLPLFLQRSEIRLPVIRIMLDSDISTDSYLPISMNPCGTFPAMYSMSLFSIPYYLAAFLALLFPGRPGLAKAAGYFDLASVSSVLLFLLVFCALTFFLALLMVDPAKIAESLERSGDFINGVRPGEETARYLRRAVCAASAVSCLGMGVVVILPLFLRVVLHSQEQIFMMPMTLAMLANMLLSLLQEVQVELRMQGYRMNL